MMDSADLGEGIAIPSFYDRKNKLRHDPDLVLAYQQQGVMLRAAMRELDRPRLVVPAEAQDGLRMLTCDVTEDESGRLICDMGEMGS